MGDPAVERTTFTFTLIYIPRRGPTPPTLHPKYCDRHGYMYCEDLYTNVHTP